MFFLKYSIYTFRKTNLHKYKLFNKITLNVWSIYKNIFTLFESL